MTQRISNRFWMLGILAVPQMLLCGRAIAQVETASGADAPPVWTSYGHAEGHLSVNYSSDGAFSPDGSRVALASDGEVLLLLTHGDAPPKVLRPRIPDVHDLEIHSVNFLSDSDVFILANGIVHPKGKPLWRTPLLAFQWNADTDQLDGKIRQVGVTGGFSPARYFPALGYLVLYKDSKFDLWKPPTGSGGAVEIPDLKQIPNIYEFSPDGHWLLLGQIQTTSTNDPSVVALKTYTFVDQLQGHEGTVLDMSFSADSSKVVTACEDGKLRVYSSGDWKLLFAITGHHGPVHRAEFSPNGKWIVSAGEDHTLRVWSAADGSPLQTLDDSKDSLIDLGISRDSRFIAAATDKEVYIWRRQGGD